MIMLCTTLLVREFFYLSFFALTNCTENLFVIHAVVHSLNV
jgi:hypothetical protein